jgi:hypothetical protein
MISPASAAAPRTSVRLQSDLVPAALVALGYGALVLLWPVLVGQDAPMWVAEGAVLRSVFHQNPLVECQLATALPPNALSQIVIGVLCTVLSPGLAGRLYEVACIATFAAALVYLCRGRAGDPRVALLSCLPLCAGYPVFHGFLNYMAALPALCFGAGFLLRHPEGRGPRGALVLMTMPVVTYLCHGVALGIWAVLVLVQIWITRSRAFAGRALAGFLPVLWLVATYVGQRQTEGASVLWTAGSILGTIGYRLRSPLRFLSVFHGFTPTFGDPVLRTVAPVLVLVNLVYAVALGAICVRWAWQARRSPNGADRFLAVSVLGLSAAFVVLPHNVANMLNPAERLVIPAVCLAAAGFSGVHEGVRSERSAARARYVLWGLLAAQWVYVVVWGSQAAVMGRAFLAARESYMSAGGAAVVWAEDVRLPGDVGAAGELRAIDLMTQHQVLLHQDALQDVVWRHDVRLATTGLFRCPADAQPAADPGALKSLNRPLLLVGKPGPSTAVANALRGDLKVVRDGPGFWILKPD